MPDTLNASATPTVRITRLFNAPRERVFDAWTTPESMRRWMAPSGVTVGEANADPRPGGTFRVAMLRAEDGDTYVMYGTYTEVRRPERLAYTMRWQEDDPALEHESSVAVDFIDRAGKTEMVFVHTNLADEASRDRHDGGWTACFEELTAFLGG